MNKNIEGKIEKAEKVLQEIIEKNEAVKPSTYDIELIEEMKVNPESRKIIRDKYFQEIDLKNTEIETLKALI